MPRGTGRLEKIRQSLSTLSVEELQQIRRSQTSSYPHAHLPPTQEQIYDESFDTQQILSSDEHQQRQDQGRRTSFQQGLEVQQLQKLQSSPARFVHWASCFIFSIITMTSAILISKGNSHLTNQTESSETWGIALPAVTLALSSIAVLMYLFPLTRFWIENRKIEGLLIITMSFVWAAAVAIISDPKDGLAVDSNGAVTNGNVYYFAWAGFVSSLTLLVSYLRSAFHVDVVGEIQSRSARLNLWSALLPTSIAVMASSANIFANQCTGPSHPASNMYCMRTLYGVTLGTCSSFIALLIVIIKMALSRVPFLVEAVSSFLLVPYFVFGVAIITYQNGPGYVYLYLC